MEDNPLYFNTNNKTIDLFIEEHNCSLLYWYLTVANPNYVFVIEIIFEDFIK
jgi:hypothetical protein